MATNISMVSDYCDQRNFFKPNHMAREGTLCRGDLWVALELVHGTFIDELITVQALGKALG